MNEKDFNKGIQELQNIRLTDIEKARMLKSIFSTTVVSPYVSRFPFLNIISRHRVRMALASFLILTTSVSGVVYGSQESLPGDLFYPIKTRVVESVLNVVNNTPEKKVIWEAEKIERRVIEAEKLAEKNELNDEFADKLEREIERGSIAFIEAANALASSSATSTLSNLEKAKDFKKDFRKKINEREKVSSENREKEIDKNNNGNEEEKIERLKNTAIRIIDDEEKIKDKDEDRDGDKESIRQDNSGSDSKDSEEESRRSERERD